MCPPELVLQSVTVHDRPAVWHAVVTHLVTQLGSGTSRLLSILGRDSHERWRQRSMIDATRQLRWYGGLGLNFLAGMASSWLRGLVIPLWT